MSSQVKVSVITPTFQREVYLRNLLACFTSQTHREAELLILDDSPEPASLFRSGEVEDLRVRYFHSAERLSIGEKRNRLLRASSGEVIVHFDDDDYYAPIYLERMLQALDGLDFVKLGSWFAYSVRARQFFYWDPERLMPHHYLVSPGKELDIVPTRHIPPDFIHRNLWGYGFSYAFRRGVCDKVAFDDINLCEDIQFFEALRDQGFRTSQFPDHEGLALHIIHAANTSALYPQFLVPSFLLRPLFGEELIAAFEEESVP